MADEEQRGRLRPGRIVRRALGRLVSPRHLRELVRRARGPHANAAVHDFGRIHERVRGKELAVFANPQLRLYARMLPGDFLHYGYFDDPSVRPETLSLEDLRRAQLRYSERVLELVVDRSRPVLDVGAGMGGMCGLLLERGFEPVALTPDRHQVEYIRAAHPDAEVIEGRFGDVGWAGRLTSFGTVITAESFQYLFLDNGVNTIARLLAPGGRWVMCDFFRRDSTAPGSGHVWADFVGAATGAGWRFVHEEEITRNVAPSMAFVEMLGRRVGAPLVEYLEASLRRRRPALHYLVEEAFSEAEGALERRIEGYDPERFVREKRYVLAVLERNEAGERT